MLTAVLGGPLDARTTLEDFTLARIYEYRVIQSHIQQDVRQLWICFSDES